MLPLVLSTLVLADPATAVSVVGRVEVRAGAATTTLVRFAQVPESATVVTYDDSLASLRLASGSLIRLGPNTEVALARLAHGTPAARRHEGFSVKVGRVWAGVLRLLGTESRFEVDTGNAVAGVRGTAFFVSVEGGTATFVVDHGALEVTHDGGATLLDAPGAALSLVSGGAPAATRMSRPGLDALRRSIGGVRSVLGVGALSSAARPGLRPGVRDRWRSDLVGPSALADSVGSTLGTVVPFPTRADLTVRVRMPAN